MIEMADGNRFNRNSDVAASKTLRTGHNCESDEPEQRLDGNREGGGSRTVSPRARG